MLIILCIFCLLSYLLLSGLILRSVSRDAVKMDVYWNGSMIEMSYFSEKGSVQNAMSFNIDSFRKHTIQT